MIPAWAAKAGAGALLLAAAAAGGSWAGWQVRDAQAQRAIVKAQEDRDAEEQRRREAVDEIARETRDGGTRYAAARAAAAGAAERLRQRAQAAVVSARAAAAAGSAPAGDPIGVLADVLGRADERAGILAEYADRARVAGLACQRSYEALTR
jgi:hypothetical protein